jgi:hypothetical protein
MICRTCREPLGEDGIVLEDAFGRKEPVHMRCLVKRESKVLVPGLVP